MNCRQIILILIALATSYSCLAQMKMPSNQGGSAAVSTNITVKIPQIANITLSENKTRQIANAANIRESLPDPSIFESIESNGKWTVSVVEKERIEALNNNKYSNNTRSNLLRTVIYITSHP